MIGPGRDSCTLSGPPSGNRADPVHYLDVGDNVHAKVSSWLGTNCGGDGDARWFIPGTCDNGHRIAKQIVCGKEWCPVCGALGSMAHGRRYARWLAKVRQFSSMTYFVFTIPENIRGRYRSREDLRDLGRAAQKILQRHGFKRGLRRWHWFGDKGGHKWHPHINVFVDGGYIAPGTLEDIKQGWRDVLGVDVVDVRASYKRRPADMAGSLHYVTRATFHDYEWDIEMALELRGFRNMVVWGRKEWTGEPAWDARPFARIDRETGQPAAVDAIEQIVNGECHVCQAKIHWSKPLPAQLLELTDKINLGAGYYQLTEMPPARDGPTSESPSMAVRRRVTRERREKIAVRRRQLIGQGYRWRRLGGDIVLERIN